MASPDQAPKADIGQKKATLDVRRLLLAIGIKRALLVAVPAVLVLLKFVYLPFAANRAMHDLSEAYGIDVRIEDWSADLFDLALTAEHVEIRTPGPYAKPELLKAESVRFDCGITTRWKHGTWVREIVLEEPSLYLEKLLSGRWNYEELLRRPPRTRSSPEDTPRGPVFASRSVPAQDFEEDSFPRLRAMQVRGEGLRVAWVEHLPGSSGTGLFHSETATLYIDDASFVLTDLLGPADDRELPSRITVEARLGDGRISLTADANFFRWMLLPDPESPLIPGPRQARLPQPVHSPSLRGTVYLENVGAGALARLIPDAAIVPTSGTMNGSMQLAFREPDHHDFRLLGEVDLASVQFAANVAAPALEGRVEQVSRALTGYRADGAILVNVDGDLSVDSFRPLTAFQGGMTYAALEAAPQEVRKVAVEDEATLSEALVDAGLLLVDKELEQALGADAAKATAEVRRGLGGRIKNWFTPGRKKKGKGSSG